MLNKSEEPDAPRLLVVFLRAYVRMTQTELGKAVGVEQALISRYESGQQAPPEEALKRMAKLAGIPWPLVMYLRRVFSAVLRLSRQTEGDEDDFLVKSVEELLDRMLVAMAPYLVTLITGMLEDEEEDTPEKLRQEADTIWTNLRSYSMSRRRRMLELSILSAQNWAMAERLCDASLEAIPADPEEALGLAGLALWIAEQVEGEEAWRSRVQGYCWAHLAHARRAAGDAPGAEEAAARAWELWEAGSSDESGLLSVERVLEMLGEEVGGSEVRWGNRPGRAGIE